MRVRCCSRFLAGAGAVLGLTALTVVYFWPILRPWATRSLGGDLAAHTYPWRLHGSRELAQGRLPHWSPHVAFGFPGLADIEGTTLYPPSLLVSLLAGPSLSYRTVELQLIAHFVVAGLGMLLLLARLGLTRAGALVGALAFTFSGFFWAHGAHLTIVQSASWGPWVLLGGTHLAERVSPRAVAATGLALALSVLGGHPQMAYLVALALVLVLGVGWAHARAAGSRQVPAWRLAAATVAALAMAVGLAAVQLWPTGVLARRSARWHAGADFLLFDAFPLPNLLTLVLPLAFRGTARWRDVDELHVYTGIVPLLLAAWALLRSRHRWAFAFAGLAGTGLVLALGGPAGEWVGGLGLFRIPARALYLFTLGLVGLAALGLDSLLRGGTTGGMSERRALWACRLGVLIVAVASVGVAVRGVGPGLRDQVAADFAEQCLRFAGLLLVSWVSLETARRFRGAVGGAAVTLMLLVDLFAFPRTLAWPARPPDWHWSRPDAVATLAQALGPHRILNEHLLLRAPTLEANSSLVFGIPGTSVYTSLSLERYDRFMRRVAPGLPLAPETYDLLAVRYVVSLQNLRELAAEAEVALGYPSEGLLPFTGGSRIARRDRRVWEVRDPLPRAYLSAGYEVADRDQILRALPDLAPRRAALLESSPQGCGPPGPWPPRPPGVVRFVADESDRVRLAVTATEPGPLVLSDTHYPGWRATLDGVRVPIHRANYLFRAVCVPAGEHVVEFTFRSPGFVPGLVVTGLAGLVGLGLAAWPSLAGWPRVARGRAPGPVTSG